jgi:tripartite-type tricarboxylate transporter receptor subunit TctC
MKRTSVLITIFFIFLILGQTLLSFGQQFPTKPIRLIVPFAAGGGTDIVARLIAKAMEKELGQKIFVENLPGGSTKVGTMAVMEAKPDGYTIMQASELTWLGGYYSNSFDSKVWEKMTPLANIALEPFGFYFVRTESPFKTWADLVKYSKENPGKQITCGISSRGAYDILGEEAAKSFGIPLFKRVPFTGGNPAIVALLGGHIDMHMGIASEAMTMLQAGKVRGLAIQTDKRLPQLPNVPTFKEMGHDVLKITATRSIWGPPNMPKNIIDIYSKAIEKATKDPEFAKPVEEIYVHTVEFRPPSKMLDAIKEYDRQIGPRLAEFNK